MARFEDEDSDDYQKVEYIDKWDDGNHNVEAMAIDIENGNLDVGDDEAAERYHHATIVRESIANGQRTQAREQCEQFGLDFADFITK